MKGFMFIVAVGAATTGAPALAQVTEPAAPASPQTASPTQAEAGLPVTADGFVPMAISSNALEIGSSRLALERSESHGVREFARKMIDDHTAAAERLQAAAAEAGFEEVPLALGARDQQMLDDLRDAEGTEFDQAFLEMQVAAHDEAVALHQTYADGGDNEALRAYASESLPTLVQHREMIGSMVAN